MCGVAFSPSCAWKTSTNPLFLLLHLLLVPLAALLQALRYSPSLRLHSGQPALRLHLLQSRAVGALGKLRPQEHVLPLGLLSGRRARQRILVKSLECLLQMIKIKNARGS